MKFILGDTRRSSPSDWFRRIFDRQFEHIHMKLASQEHKIEMLIEALTEERGRINHLMAKSYNTAPLPFVDKPYWQNYGSLQPARWGYKGVINNVETYIWAEHYSNLEDE